MNDQTNFRSDHRKIGKDQNKKQNIEQESTMNILYRIEKHSMNIFNKNI